MKVLIILIASLTCGASAQTAMAPWTTTLQPNGITFETPALRSVPWKGKNEKFKLVVSLNNRSGVAWVRVVGPFSIMAGDRCTVEVETDRKKSPTSWEGFGGEIYPWAERVPGQPLQHFDLIAAILDSRSFRLHVKAPGASPATFDFNVTGLRAAAEKHMITWYQHVQPEQQLPPSLTWMSQPAASR